MVQIVRRISLEKRAVTGVEGDQKEKRNKGVGRDQVGKESTIDR